MTTPSQPSSSSVWIIQNIRGDFNDEYYTPRSTQKFFLTEHDAIQALVPFHQSVAAKSLIAKRINRSDDPGALWHELVRFIHFSSEFSVSERDSLAAELQTTPAKLEDLLRWSSDFDDGREEYRLLQLRLDAEVPCSNGYYESDRLKDLQHGEINQEMYEEELERHKRDWWKIEH